MSKLLNKQFFVNTEKEYFIHNKIIEKKYKEGIECLYEYLEDLRHMIISRNHMPKTMGYNTETKRCYFYNTEKCLHDMILSGMRQRYLLYKLDLFLRKKCVKVSCVNDTDLYLEEFDDTEEHFITRENGCYYKFTKRDIRKIFKLALTSVQEGVPDPQQPTNPYTKKQFNDCELMDMYEFMGPKSKLIHLFRLSHFNINRFGAEWYETIVKEMLIERVKTFTSRKIFNIIKHMCKVLMVNVPSNRCIKEYLNRYQEDIHMIIARYYEFDMKIMPGIEEFAIIKNLCEQLSNNISIIGRQLRRRHRAGVGANSIYNSMMNDDIESDGGVESGDSSDEDELDDLMVQSIEITPSEQELLNRPIDLENDSEIS